VAHASAATIGVAPEVIARIHRLKTLTVQVRAGKATRRCRVVKSAEPDDLVFQSIKDVKPMSDQNVLKRHASHRLDPSRAELRGLAMFA
jgi:hypothetical protein